MNQLKSRYGKRIQKKILRIKNAEADAQKRNDDKKRELYEDIEKGNKAMMCKDFADEILADAENVTLESLINVKSYEDLLKVRANYIAALAFYQKIHNISQKGRIAEEKLNKIKKAEGK